MEVPPEPVRWSDCREPLTPYPIILPAEAMAVTLLILVLALGLMLRNGA